MTVYVTAEFTPKNKEMLKAYSEKASATITEFDGEFLVKAPIQSLSGISNYTYKAIIRFPSKTLAEKWFNSPQYQDLISVRDQGMDSCFLLIG